MNCEWLAQRVREYLVTRTGSRPFGSGCRLDLPLLEPSGDAVAVYIEEAKDHFVIHDGGRISGILFDVGPSGATQQERRTIQTLLENSGLHLDKNRAVVFAEAEQTSLAYWILEVGRTVAVASTIVPVAAPRKRPSRRLGPRVAAQLTQRLLNEGLMTVIQPGMSMRGVTQQERRVDLIYTVPGAPLHREITVFILAMDLDVADPIRVATRGLAAATDLTGSDLEPIVRVVHSAGAANGRAENARRLIQQADKRHLLQEYSWDNPSDQDRFLNTIRQEVAPLLGS